LLPRPDRGVHRYQSETQRDQPISAGDRPTGSDFEQASPWPVVVRIFHDSSRPVTVFAGRFACPPFVGRQRGLDPGSISRAVLDAASTAQLLRAFDHRGASQTGGGAVEADPIVLDRHGHRLPGMADGDIASAGVRVPGHVGDRFGDDRGVA
jgi:hypothetical protein